MSARIWADAPKEQEGRKHVRAAELVRFGVYREGCGQSEHRDSLAEDVIEGVCAVGQRALEVARTTCGF